IRRKHGEEPVTYLHPSLEPALRDTYGIFVYQEDIMTAAIAMADYTGPEADNLCYAIRKKKESVLHEHEAKFKAGAKKKGIPPSVVDQVFAAFEPFARYGFNKAHATCYGLIAYQTAYLKANYPVEFMTAVLNGFRERAEKVAAVVAECRRLGIAVRPPDVQASQALFTVETDADGTSAIRFGLAAIKNVGEGAIDSIVAAREGRGEASDVAGPFASLDDLCRRIDLRTVNKRVFESLIKAGAMASLGSLGSLLARLDAALESGSRHQRDVAAGQGTLFDLFAAPVEGLAPMLAGAAPDEDEVPRKERLRWEKQLLGLYLSEHPLGDIADQLPDYVTAYTGDLAEESDQAKVTLGGIIQSTRRVITRAGSTMLVATLEDLQGSVEVVVFPKVFTETANAWADDAVVLITGRVDRRDDAAQLLCETVHAWDDAVRMGPLAYAAERDRLSRARTRPGSWAANGNSHANGNGHGQPPPAPMAPVALPRGVTSPVQSAEETVAVPVVARVAAIPVRPVEPAEESPAPLDAVPVRAGASEGEVPSRGASTISIGFAGEVDLDRLLPAIESLTAAIRGRPGSLPVVINIPVAGATRQVRLPLHAEWDDRLGDLLTRAAGLPLAVSLLAVAVEP
ncbi:MAG: helix-hairpin-helix domain-containing protein, partial [Myxococcaceae bacterium]